MTGPGIPQEPAGAASRATRAAIEAALRRAGTLPDHPLDLAETALLLAACDAPETPLDAYRRHLGLLVEEVKAEAGSGPDLAARGAALQTVLGRRHGYAGDSVTYDDLQNASLIRTIDRRRGLPVALTILYVHAARGQGWPAEGVTLPGHVLARIGDGAGRYMLLDPFEAGVEVNAAALRRLLARMLGEEAEAAPERHAPLGDRDLLLRLQNNMKLRLLQAGRSEAAAAVLERMLMIAPARAWLWLEIASLREDLGVLRLAIEAAEEAVRRAVGEGQRQMAAALLQKLRCRLH